MSGRSETSEQFGLLGRKFLVTQDAFEFQICQPLDDREHIAIISTRPLPKPEASDPVAAAHVDVAGSGDRTCACGGASGYGQGVDESEDRLAWPDTTGRIDTFTNPYWLVNDNVAPCDCCTSIAKRCAWLNKA